MCKYNFNPKPNNVHECWEECECNSCTEKRGEVERLFGCTSVKGSTMAVHHSIQPDKTPPAFDKYDEYLTEQKRRRDRAWDDGFGKGHKQGKSEGRKDVLDEIEQMIDNKHKGVRKKVSDKYGNLNIEKGDSESWRYKGISEGLSWVKVKVLQKLKRGEG